MILYILSVFISAFLLFQVQPMISRYIQPYFGGTPAVWSTVQLFFEVFLTGGYAYATWLIRRLSTRTGTRLHISVLAVSLVMIIFLAFVWPAPVIPDASWKPASVETPILDIFKLLFVAVGLPYFLLSTNSPLTQAWFARSQPGRSPYWLYALSNIGSLLGLLAYPFVIEPNLTLKTQGWVWAGGYALFVLLAGYGAYKSAHAAPAESSSPQTAEAQLPVPKPSGRTQALWILLSAIGTTLLLAVTSHITQEVAAIPLLWVVPLAIYLFTFILTYSGGRWYNSKIFAGLMILASGVFLWAWASVEASFISRTIGYCFFLFASLMICNGETYRLRPHPAHLTRFYLMTSIGGALGGIFVNLIAPLIFKGYWELLIGFGVSLALALAVLLLRKSTALEMQTRFVFNVVASIAVLLTIAFSLYGFLAGSIYGELFQARNFFGVVRVREVHPDDPEWHGYTVAHGTTLHGLQFTAADKHSTPTAYFARQSGAGLAILNHPKYGHNMKMGVLGLGIGTLVAYGQPGDDYRLYEINPIMVELAEGKYGYFSFLPDNPATKTILVGDARLSLENELAAHGSNNFDLLAIDVFSSDSIPVHLVTKEAFDIYLQHLAPDGVIAINISTRYVDLVPVIWQISKYYNLAMVVIPTNPEGYIVFPSNWVLLSRSPELLQVPAIAERAYPMDDYTTDIRLWTDDFSNLFQILK